MLPIHPCSSVVVLLLLLIPGEQWRRQKRGSSLCSWQSGLDGRFRCKLVTCFVWWLIYIWRFYKSAKVFATSGEKPQNYPQIEVWQHCAHCSQFNSCAWCCLYVIWRHLRLYLKVGVACYFFRNPIPFLYLIHISQCSAAGFHPFIQHYKLLRPSNIISILSKTCAVIQSQLAEPFSLFTLAYIVSRLIAYWKLELVNGGLRKHPMIPSRYLILNNPVH